MLNHKLPKSNQKLLQTTLLKSYQLELTSSLNSIGDLVSNKL